MAVQVREMGVGALLDTAITIFRRHFRLIMGVTACTLVPTTAAAALAAAFFAGVSTPTVEVDPGEPAMVVLALAGTAMSVLVTLLGTIFVAPFAKGVIYSVAAADLMGRPIDRRECFARTRRAYPRLMLAGAIYLIAQGIGYMLCALPGYYVLFVFYLAEPIVMLEDAPVVAAFKRGRILVRRHVVRVIGAVIVAGLAMAFTQAIPYVVPNIYATAVLIGLSGGAGGAFGAILQAVVYFSARCRQESLDLDLLVAEVDSAAPAIPAL